ncbi:MAG: archaeosortase/exosortase family protein, partial [Deltaproteobacteria bacterium]|nr:archaeosortase/exosortase family protein [Deltaproteobacteria bacterium]
MAKSLQHQAYQWLSYGLILGLWLFLFFPVFQWLGASFYTPEYRWHTALFILLIAVFLKKIFSKDLPDFCLQLRLIPFFILFLGVLGFLVSERFLDMDLVSCFFFGWASFGLAGLFLQKERWKASLPYLLLFLAVLPFSFHIETFLGFPLRVITAKVAYYFFESIGIHGFNHESIILVENKLAHVDLPCSGLKSLWVGSLFILALSVLENYKI